MHHPWTSTRALRSTRGSVLAVTGVAALLTGLAGCASDEGEEGTQDEAEADTETTLDQAHLAKFGDTKADPEQSEQGEYSQLKTTQQTNEMREGTNLDKPDCVDAVNQWSRMPEVSDAQASLATYPRGEDVITHTLIELSESAAKEAVDTKPPEECANYQATLEDGSTTTYTLRDLDLDTVGDDSHAFVAEAESGGDTMYVYNLVYRNRDHLSTVTLLGDGED